MRDRALLFLTSLFIVVGCAGDAPDESTDAEPAAAGQDVAAGAEATSLLGEPLIAPPLTAERLAAAALERIKGEFRRALQPLKPGAPLPY